MKSILFSTLIATALSATFSSAAWSQTTFQVDLDKIKKSNKALVLAETTEKQIKAHGALASMKYHATRNEWKECADLRANSLKAQPTLAGWIWNQSFQCELQAFKKDPKREAKLKTFVQAFNSQLDLLDRGGWKKELQSQWLEAHQELRSLAKTPQEKQKWAHSLYQRPELLSADMELDLLRDLQKTFALTKSSQTSSQKTATVVTEPWWESARKMDYPQVVKLLEEYLDNNSAPSNQLSARLLLGRGYLWTGRYEEAKDVFLKLQNEFPLSEEGVEAAFRLGLLHLRLGNPQLAISTFDKLLATGREKNPLTTRYWRLRALELAGQKELFATERDAIIAQYPFTYFGLKLRVEMQQGKLEFPQAASPERRSVWVWPKSAQSQWKRFLDLAKVGWLNEAAVELQDLLTVADAEAYQMWAEFAADMKLDFLAIRFSQQAQNLDERLMNWSFQKKFMPMTYQKVVMAQSEIHKVEPWMIWAIIRQESAFNPKALSSSNAYGLMQLIGPTAQEVAQDLKTTVTIPDELFVPEKNIPFGARYLAKMKNEFSGHWPLAVAAYNAGPSRLKSWLKLRKDTENLPTLKSVEWRDEIWIDELPWNETQNYVKSVMRNFILYRLGSQSQWTLPPVFWSESTPGTTTSGARLIEKQTLKR